VGCCPQHLLPRHHNLPCHHVGTHVPCWSVSCHAALLLLVVVGLLHLCLRLLLRLAGRPCCYRSDQLIGVCAWGCLSCDACWLVLTDHCQGVSAVVAPLGLALHISAHLHPSSL
jgi:hypothetical protein